jgi:N-acetylneuraminate synthase
MTYIIGEIGLNHSGSLDTALDLIDVAKECGCDAVKFQKREPRVCTPKSEWDKVRETPWGTMSYIEYREKVEFGRDEYDEINNYCIDIDIAWFASAWDLESLDFLSVYKLPFIKIPSAQMVDWGLLRVANEMFDNIIVSTGMSTLNEIYLAKDIIGDNGIIMHCTSTYPCPLDELNLEMIRTLKRLFPNNTIGYSGHEVGLSTTVAAVALGAKFIERHITLDRAMWGTDQAASVEPQGLRKLVKDIRTMEVALGDGVKRVYDSELPSLIKLRGGK